MYRTIIGETEGMVNAKASLAHPFTDEVSLGIGQGSYSNFPYSVELAFFKNDEWVKETIPEFAAWADGGGSYPVYGWVPLHVFADFLKNWRTM